MSSTAQPQAGSFGRDYADEQLRRSRHPLRRLVKSFYLRRILDEVDGPTIDFGCGAGQLLARLPAGSLGIELNVHLISSLRAAGLAVRQAQGNAADFELADIEPGRYRCLVIAHVLEHLDDPQAALVCLLRRCAELGVERVVVVVPGEKGYRSDATHRTFIDRRWLAEHPLSPDTGFRACAPRYFPGPAWVGPLFVFHEMTLVFERERN